MTDRYKIISLIKKDQLGGTYLAEDTELEREVTFRHLDPGYEPTPSENWKSEFSQYAAKLQALRHPNLIGIFDTFFDEDDPIIISEVLKGDPLSDCIKNKPLKALEVVNMAMDLLSGLQPCHDSKIFHGAMHTGSVMRFPLPHGGHHYTIIDLGLKHLSSLVKGKETRLEDPILLAPELNGNTEAADAQSDLFMIGQLCFTAIAGGHPYAEDSLEDCAKAYRANRLPALHKFAPDVPPGLENWIKSLTYGNPKKRPQSVEDAIESLKKISLDPPSKSAQSVKALAVPRIKQHAPVIPYTGSYNKPSSIHSAPSATQKKSSPVKIIIGLVAILLITGIVISISSRQKKGQSSGKKPQVAQSDKNNSSEAKSPLAKKKTTSPSTDVKDTPGSCPYTITQAKQIGDTHLLKTPIHFRFNSTDYNDWVLLLNPATGSEKTQFRYKPNSPYTLEVTEENTIGTPYSPNLLTYRFTKRRKGRVKPIPSCQASIIKTATTTAPKSWIVSFRPPSVHRGSIDVIFHFTQKNCNLAFTITDAEKNHYTLQANNQTPGVVKLKIHFPQIKVNKRYAIHIKATPTPSNQSFIVGLHGVFLKKSTLPIATNQGDKSSVPKSLTSHKKSSHKKRSKVNKHRKKRTIKSSRSSTDLKLAIAPFSSQNKFTSPNWYHTEGCIIKEGKGRYYLFYTRWPKSKHRFGKLPFGEIAIAISTSPTGPWKHWKTILKGRGPNHWDQLGVCHPIVKHYNGYYYLYYVSTSGNLNNNQLNSLAINGFADNHWGLLIKNRRIGIARTKSLKSPWKQMSKPLISPKPPFTDFTAYPLITKTPDNKYTLLVKSRAIVGAKKQITNLTFFAKSDKPEGPFTIPPSIVGSVKSHYLAYWYHKKNHCFYGLESYPPNRFLLLTLRDGKQWGKHSILIPGSYKSTKGTVFKPKEITSASFLLDDNDMPEVLIVNYSNEKGKERGILTIPFRR